MFEKKLEKNIKKLKKVLTKAAKGVIIYKHSPNGTAQKSEPPGEMAETGL